MGKSNKKFKNDRINTIRKQYDAYLEEDKKRRERNEYILCKLDKMRSSTALVPISSKAKYHMELINPSETFMRPNNLRTKVEMRDNYVSHLERQNVTSVIDTPIDELRILKEISKKYILIPKRLSTESNYVYNNNVLDDDWKSKYNILDHLKKQEKEPDTDPVFNQCNDDNNNVQNKKLDLPMDSNISDKHPPNLIKNLNHLDKRLTDKYNESTTVNKSDNSPVTQETVNKNVNFKEIICQGIKESEIPLKTASISLNQDIRIDQTQFDNNSTQEFIANAEEENVIEKEKYNSESNEKDLNSVKNSQKSEMSNTNNATAYQESVNPSDFEITTTETKKYIENPENINADMNKAAISEHIISNAKPLETETIEYSEGIEHHDQNIDNQKHTTEIQGLTSTTKVDLYNVMDNNPEAQIETNETNLDKPYHYDPVQNTIPVDIENVQHPEHVEHESEINAFEAEQKEMFYSEQNQGDTYSYNQGEGNAGQYTDGYEQNDQYAYYEGVQQEQAYATNINEHEESTERYDPHYNEQYEGSYESQQPDNTVGYENTSEYEQQQFHEENQQSQDITNYENQQENAHLYQENVTNENEIQENVLSPEDNQIYDQHLYAEHSDTQEMIEQQLTNEEGYIESSPVTSDAFPKENEGEIEQVMETAAAEEPMPDPKVT